MHTLYIKKKVVKFAPQEKSRNLRPSADQKVQEDQNIFVFFFKILKVGKGKKLIDKKDKWKKKMEKMEKEKMRKKKEKKRRKKRKKNNDNKKKNYEKKKNRKKRKRKIEKKEKEKRKRKKDFPTNSHYSHFHTVIVCFSIFFCHDLFYDIQTWQAQLQQYEFLDGELCIAIAALQCRQKDYCIWAATARCDIFKLNPSAPTFSRAIFCCEMGCGLDDHSCSQAYRKFFYINACIITLPALIKASFSWTIFGKKTMGDTLYNSVHLLRFIVLLSKTYTSMQ
ncbi:hypothetical protein RFI_30242 [Reticulomyxa filosa]|uniref:Uncharacterized protein n=1 Tax=Reticulomyxa filosa TaxID=46433 RepID=X6M2E6_RETFI|nr:hypothetical protein RFI_30242 [Reticulomyxa filosa]|eukprot:ETO07150.1 hypothetical protein RFI_30242 [Reticulomyxa filosa]